MNGHLTAYFRERRLRRGLSLHALARLVAPGNARKVAGRIGRFEAEGVIGEDLFVAVAEALGIDLPTVEELMDRDRAGEPRSGDPPQPAPPPVQSTAANRFRIEGPTGR